MLWERTTALFEGVLVWVLSLILILYLAASGIGLIATGAFNLVGNTAKAVGSSGMMSVDALATGSVDEMLGRLRDPQTAAVVAGATGTSREEASRTLQEMSQRVEAARNNPAEAAAEMRRGLAGLTAQAQRNLSQAAAEAKPEATATAWVTFGALVLSLLAAITGAAVGRRAVVGRADRRRAL